MLYSEGACKTLPLTGKAVKVVGRNRQDRRRVQFACSNEQELISGSVSITVPLASPLSFTAYHAVSVCFNTSHFD